MTRRGSWFRKRKRALSNPPPFEIVEHTADIGFRAWGATPEELFANSALALESVAVELEGVEPRFAYPITVTGQDWESVLVAWLSEVLYHLDGEQVVMSRFEIDRIGPTEAAGRGFGEPRDPKRHPPKLVVKGVTYHQLRVEQTSDGWMAQVFLDI